MPAQEAVLVTTSGLTNMQALLDLAWEHLLPALGDGALPADDPANAALTRRLAGLVLPAPQGAATSPLAAGVSGHTFAFAANAQGVKTVRYDFADDRATITIADEQGTHTLVGGRGAWLADTADYGNSRWPAGSGADSPRAASAVGAWTDEQTFEFRLRYTNTPFGFTLVSRFAADRVSVEYRENVGFVLTERPPLEGQRT